MLETVLPLPTASVNAPAATAIVFVPSPDGETMEVSDDRRKKSDDRRKRVDRRSGDRRDKNWAQKKHEDKVFNQ